MSTWRNPLNNREFMPQSEKNGILHPPSCACVKCSAGRESQDLSEEIIQRIRATLDDAFVNFVQANFLGGLQAFGQGQLEVAVRAGFIQGMANAFRMREIAAAYFAESKEVGE